MSPFFVLTEQSARLLKMIDKDGFGIVHQADPDEVIALAESTHECYSKAVTAAKRSGADRYVIDGSEMEAHWIDPEYKKENVPDAEWSMVAQYRTRSEIGEVLWTVTVETGEDSGRWYLRTNGACDCAAPRTLKRLVRPGAALLDSLRGAPRKATNLVEGKYTNSAGVFARLNAWRRKPRHESS